jgi:hypothetical protein
MSSPIGRLAACLAVLLLPATSRADVTWPADQLLPSFPAPAPTQDLILLHGRGAMRWEAEGPAIGHATGRADGDGWLCQTGIDEARRHMVYGPYDSTLPAGGNTARFRIKIDNNSADDAHQVTIDVRDSTTGAVLASQDVTRRQFTVAGDWVTFALPFSIPAQGHAIELRVWWAGGAYIKVDSVGVDRGSEDELVLFASLKGVVNATRPRIFSYEGDAFAEGKHTWLSSLGLAWQEHTDNWALIGKYRSEIEGVIVYDPLVPDTMNLATTMAARRKALVVSPALLPRLTGTPHSLPVLEDLRGRFANKVAVYDSMFANQWPTVTHRVLLGLSPDHHKAALREYAIALGAAVVWLDPEVAAESAVLDRFLAAMGPGNAYMGWWPEEGPGVERGSRFGIATVASDYATNLTLHSGMPRTVGVKVIPPKPILQNRIYVAFILSDGDNLQYVEHLMRKLWNDPGRGRVPIGWTVSPAMLDAMPGALDFYHRTSTDSDNLVSGPSGWGYGYPNSWPSSQQLDQFVARTEDYALRAGLRVVTVWNTITGGINGNVGASFAAHAPSLLGLTAQNTGGGLTVYSGRLPGFALSCNYCTNEQAMKDHIATAAAGWNRTTPRFVLIQAQPWQGVTPTSFLNVKNSLNADHVVVRPDNWFQLLRQANGLPIEPVAPVATGVYRLVNKASGRCVAAAGGSTENRTHVEQVACADVDAQRWRVTTTSNGYVTIAAFGDDGQVLDIDGGPGATGDGAKVILWEDLGGTNQQWQPVWESGRVYHFIPRHSDRCLDVPSGTSEQGVQLQQWGCNGAAAQSFELAEPGWTPPPDAGVPDAGVVAGGPDAGPVDPGVDAGGGEDAAAGADGGDDAPAEGDPSGGCGCSGGGGAGPLTGLVLFLVARRSGRRPR